MRRHRLGLILAGGDGVRLRAMPRRLTGDGRPKQFCALVSDHLFLTEIQRRVALSVPAHGTPVVVNRAPEPFYIGAGRRLGRPGRPGAGAGHATTRARSISHGTPEVAMPDSEDARECSGLGLRPTLPA